MLQAGSMTYFWRLTCHINRPLFSFSTLIPPQLPLFRRPSQSKLKTQAWRHMWAGYLSCLTGGLLEMNHKRDARATLGINASWKRALRESQAETPLMAGRHPHISFPPTLTQKQRNETGSQLQHVGMAGWKPARLLFSSIPLLCAFVSLW